MTHEHVGPAPVPSAEQPANRLESWKDIAAYLRRDVSTVQRWEKREGMPVHRHLHDKQGSVYAFRSELDGWWRGRANRLTGNETGQLAPAGPDEPAVRTDRRRSWRPVALVGLGVFAVA